MSDSTGTPYTLRWGSGPALQPLCGGSPAAWSAHSPPLWLSACAARTAAEGTWSCKQQISICWGWRWWCPSPAKQWQLTADGASLRVASSGLSVAESPRILRSHRRWSCSYHCPLCKENTCWILDPFISKCNAWSNRHDLKLQIAKKTTCDAAGFFPSSAVFSQSLLSSWPAFFFSAPPIDTCFYFAWRAGCVTHPCSGRMTYAGAGRQTEERNERKAESCSGRAGKTEIAFFTTGTEGIGYYPDMQPWTDGDDSVWCTKNTQQCCKHHRTTWVLDVPVT